MRLLHASLLFVLACITPPEALIPREYDLDGDHSPDVEDCAPSDPEVRPGADERCNGVDDDCDGELDEGFDTTLFYEDLDGDGWGDATVPVMACRRPLGFTARSGDCNQHDADVHPGAAERCDLVDHDCDGDFDDAPAGELFAWYADADGDGWGDAGDVLHQCLKPGGYVDDALDCDDTRADVHPAAAEICDDADTDEDCDGLPDEADDWQADGEPMYPDTDGDGFGAARGPLAWRCAPGNGYTLDASDCADDDPASWPGAEERCDGADNDCDAEVDEDAIDPPRWYFDGDADGWGDPGRATRRCLPDPSWVAVADDCDDTDAARHPGAPEADCTDPVDYNCDGYAGPDDHDGDGDAACAECDDGDAAVCLACDETCDGRDEDCDGAADEDAVDAPAWYHDRDHDGYGSAVRWVRACDGPPQHVANADDCLDLDATRYPGAAEVCGDGMDQDCDGADATCLW